MKTEGLNLPPELQGYDVFIAGSGPIGATYAKKCVDAGLRVIMAEIGAADSFISKPLLTPEGQRRKAPSSTNTFEDGYVMVPGYHKKNEIEYQKDIDRFVNVIKGALSTCSIPTSNNAIPTLDPSCFQNTAAKPFVTLGKNPHQDPFSNLGAEAVTKGVGGMTTHWTCATPRLNPHIERPKLVEDAVENDKLWGELYSQAESLIGTSTTQFDKSIRHTLVLKTLQKGYEEQKRTFRPLPLACHRLQDPDYVEWHATDRILEELFTHPEKKSRFKLLTNHRCTKVEIQASGTSRHQIVAAKLKNLLPKTQGSDAEVYVQASAYVIAAGAVATAQILANSQKPPPMPGPSPQPTDRIIKTPLTPNLGKYITEQPMTFCQVILDERLMALVDKNPWGYDWWAEAVKRHTERHPEDPIHIPFRDPEPQVTTPFTEKHPWHTQIHRDAFSYGAVAETIDTRLIVDLRFFGYVEPRAENELVFQEFLEDAYGMPQPTFRFSMSPDDRDRAHRMMDDMCDVALKLGGFLPGSEPQFMTPGLALHLAGTVRAGLEKDKATTVADTHSKVWDFDNLYVGGNGVIPTGFGANPTLTSICYAIRGANHIIEQTRAKKAGKAY